MVIGAHIPAWVTEDTGYLLATTLHATMFPVVFSFPKTSSKTCFTGISNAAFGGKNEWSVSQCGFSIFGFE